MYKRGYSYSSINNFTFSKEQSISISERSMLYKKYIKSVYNGENAPHFKTYKTEDDKDTLTITKNYSVLKQGKYFKMISEKLY